MKCYRCSAILGRKLLKKTKIKKWCQVCFHIAVSLATSVFLYFFRCISVFLSMYSAILKSGGAAAAFALSLPPFWQHLYFFLYFCISSFVFLYFCISFSVFSNIEKWWCCRVCSHIAASLATSGASKQNYSYAPY